MPSNDLLTRAFMIYLKYTVSTSGTHGGILKPKENLSHLKDKNWEKGPVPKGMRGRRVCTPLPCDEVGVFSCHAILLLMITVVDRCSVCLQITQD